MRIILAFVIFLIGFQVSSAQEIFTAVPPPECSYPMTAPPQLMVAPGQSYLQPGPMVVPPGAPAAPNFGQPVIMTPLAPGTVVPGSPPLPPIGAPPGAAIVPPTPVPPNAIPVAPNPEAMNLGPNPISIPAVDEHFAWDQIVDVVSEYFTVAREQQVRRSGEVWTEGIIETAPQDGATWLEPHRKDSVGSFNRWESTFQTIRRRAHVRVMPEAAGYLVEVVVEKELEDLPNPEKATAGGATFRNDNAPSSRRLEEVSRTRLSPLWIQLGRDPLLEQRILGDIQARLGGVAAGAPTGLAR
jgi:hypothetical protein